MENKQEPKKNVKFNMPVFIGIMIFILLILSLFLSGIFSFKPLSGDVVFNGVKVKTVENKTTHYTIEGSIVNNLNLLLWRTYSIGVTEDLLSKSYELKFSVPVWRDPLSSYKKGECVKFELEYSKFLNLIYFIKSGNFIGVCTNAPENVEEIDIEKLINDISHTVESFYNEEKMTYPMTLECGVDGCDGTMVEGPLSWFRYGQYASDKNKGNVDYERYLSDFDIYEPEDFFWRQFQYGYIVNSDPDMKEKYGQKYIDIVMSNTKYDGVAFDDYYFFYTSENQPSQTTKDDFERNFGEMDSNDYDLTAGKLAYEILDYSYAYEIEPDVKYRNLIDYNLWFGHQLIYFMDDLQSPEPTEIKPSSCNMMYADVRAYEITKDERYLQYFNYIVEKDYLSYLYSDVELVDTQDYTYSPMTYLPCMEAFEVMIRLEKGEVEKYKEYQKMFMDYIFSNGLIDLVEGSETYGTLLVGDKGVDLVYSSRAMSSTCWFIKILSDINERGGL